MTRTIRNNDWWQLEELVLSKLYKVAAKKWLRYLPDAFIFIANFFIVRSVMSVWLIAFRRGKSLQTNKQTKKLWLCTNIACFSIASVQKCCLLYTYKTQRCYRWRWLQDPLTKAPYSSLIRGRIQIVQGVYLHISVRFLHRNQKKCIVFPSGKIYDFAAYPNWINF